MNIIANLTPEECQGFLALFPYIIDGKYIFADQEIYSKCELNNHLQMLFDLEDTGIIKHVSSPVSLTINTTMKQDSAHRSEGVSFRTISNTLTIIKYYKIKMSNGQRDFDLTPFANKIRCVDLTKVGKEIFTALVPLIDYKDPEFVSESSKYLGYIAEYFKNRMIGDIKIEITDRDSDSYYRK
ncbi:hypothetical protein BHC25_09360 [Mannheimia haemolytica]|nr:hypothetical protein BHC25_09360 [Mannheimia haemolytica]